MKGRILAVAIVLAMSSLAITAKGQWSQAQQQTALVAEVRQAAGEIAQALPRAVETPVPNGGFKHSPVMFVENAGQWDDGARFQVWGGPAGTMWLAEDAIWITVLEPGETSGQVDTALDSRLRWSPEDREEPAPRSGVNIKLSFVGANPQPRIETFDRLDSTVSYFLGNDPGQWRPDVPVWGAVRYVDLYPGIDMEVTNEDGRMVQRLAARPGADLAAVQLRVEGADAVAVDGDRLRLSTAAGDLALPLLQAAGSNGEAPVQPRGVRLFDVSTPFAALSSTPYSPLAMPDSPADNPADLLYGTFLGGSGSYYYYGDRGAGIAVDDSGDAFVTGVTNSSDFPATPGAFDTSYDYEDAFVVKLDSAGSGLIYATFLGLSLIHI